MRHRALVITAGASCTAFVACSLAFPISDDAASARGTRAEAGSPDATPADASADVGDGSRDVEVTFACEQTGKGPELVALVDRLCIDRTEVTAAQYAAFLDAGVRADDQALAHCVTQNRSFAPRAKSDAGDYPVHGVDWCDAFAFCRWAGKTLCGRFPGVTSDPLDAGADADAGFNHGLLTREVTDRDASAWAWACRGPLAQIYPYGNDLDYEACANAGGGFAAPNSQPVASMPKCEGGFPGIFDMVGNVGEWIDGCTNGTCYAVGTTSCTELRPFSSLAFQFLYDGTSPNPVIGFRCCGLEPPRPVASP